MWQKGATYRGKRDTAGAAGVAVLDVSASVPFASRNVVTHNVLRNNDVDLFVTSTGTGNVIEHNKCATSVPDGLCTPH